MRSHDCPANSNAGHVVVQDLLVANGFGHHAELLEAEIAEPLGPDRRHAGMAAGECRFEMHMMAIDPRCSVHRADIENRRSRGVELDGLRTEGLVGRLDRAFRPAVPLDGQRRARLDEADVTLRVDERHGQVQQRSIGLQPDRAELLLSDRSDGFDRDV